MQGARIWLPNIDGFFMSLGRLLEVQKGKGTLHPTIRLNFLVLSRIEEAFPNEVGVISDLNELVFIMNELSRDFDRIVEDSERSMFTAPSSQNDRLSAVARNGLVGRPRLHILQEQLLLLIANETAERRREADEAAALLSRSARFLCMQKKFRVLQRNVM